ncbi:hypothetical protein [Solibacillus sp. CAU 1738]|uniref:hypothetical protein n=1 Tax=Solibacillus sp. CAU 1738 TaxID=3140363 RepID=UPI0032601C8C
MTNYSVFQVIKIIDEYSVVINGGLDESICKGDEIEIFVEGDVITDPFNDNKELGTLDFIKASLEAVEVYRNFSVCKKFEEKEVYTPSAIERVIAPMGQFQGSTKIVKTLKKIEIDEKEITGRIKGDSIIKIGDSARLAITG